MNNPTLINAAKKILNSLLSECTEIIKQYTPDQLNAFIQGLSPEQMDGALDILNSLGLKKIGTDEKGRELWSTK